MSASFTNQVIAQIELARNRDSYEKKVYVLPKILDEKVARLHLDKLGARLTELSAEQADYIGVDKEGPYIQGKTLRENLFDYGGPEGEARGVSVQVVENVIYGVSRDRADERLEGKRSWRIIGLGLNRNHGGTRLRGSWEIRARWGRPPGS